MNDFLKVYVRENIWIKNFSSGVFYIDSEQIAYFYDTY